MIQTTVRINDCFLAMVARGVREPTKEEYQEIARRTNTRFKKYIEHWYKEADGVEFVDLKSEIGQTSFGEEAGIPSEKYNIYIKFAFFDIVYSADSDIPGKEETLKLMKNAISKNFIEEVVRSFAGTPFESTTEVWFAKD